MHDVPYLLASLASRGVLLHIEGDELRYRAPAGALTPADRETLKRSKPDIVEHLRVRALAARPDPVARPGDPIPASLIQRVWVRLMNAPHAPGMEKLPLVLSYEGVEAADAEAAIRALVQRHDALRARFSADGTTVTLNAAADLPVRVERCADRAALARALAGVVDPPLPLDGDWLVRPAVLQQADGPTLVVLLFHHIVCDGAALATVMREINLHIAGRPPSEPALQYSDYARAENDWYESQAGAIVARYARERFGALPLLHSPSGRALTWEPGEKLYRPIDLPQDASRKVAEAAVALRSTAFVTIVCAYARALARWSGQDCFGVRVVGDQRTTNALADLVGMMTVTDVLDLRGAASAEQAELMVRVASEAQCAMEVRAVAHPGPQGWHDFRELTGATINYMPLVPPEPLPPEIRFAEPPYLASAAEHLLKSPEPVPAAPVFLRLIEEEDGLGGRFEFNAGLVTEAEQAALIRGFREALEEIVG